jgi:hypothetical protein
MWVGKKFMKRTAYSGSAVLWRRGVGSVGHVYEELALMAWARDLVNSAQFRKVRSIVALEVCGR